MEPVTRKEMFLAAAGLDIETPTPITREEMFFERIGGRTKSLGYAVMFTVSNSDYYYVSVPEGGSVTKPADPTEQGYEFDEWQIEGEAVIFPYTTTADVTINAKMDWNHEFYNTTISDLNYINNLVIE